MKVVVQRVTKASVSIKNIVYNKITNGFLLLVGFEEGDGASEINYIAHKISQLRVFSDETGKMNLNIQQINGEVLSISQFTLYAALKKVIDQVLQLLKTPRKQKIIMKFLILFCDKRCQLLKKEFLELTCKSN